MQAKKLSAEELREIAEVDGEHRWSPILRRAADTIAAQERELEEAVKALHNYADALDSAADNSRSAWEKLQEIEALIARLSSPATEGEESVEGSKEDDHHE